MRPAFNQSLAALSRGFLQKAFQIFEDGTHHAHNFVVGWTFNEITFYDTSFSKNT